MFHPEVGTYGKGWTYVSGMWLWLGGRQVMPEEMFLALKKLI